MSWDNTGWKNYETHLFVATIDNDKNAYDMAQIAMKAAVDQFDDTKAIKVFADYLYGYAIHNMRALFDEKGVDIDNVDITDVAKSWINDYKAVE